MTIPASTEIPNVLCLHECLRGLWENDRLPSHPEQWEGGQVAYFSRTFTCTPLQASRSICLSFQGLYSREEQKALFRNHWPSSKCKGTGKFWAHISPGLQPWAFLQMHFSGRRKAEQMDGLLTGSEYFPEHKKQADSCSCCCWVLPIPTEGWAQLRDLKPNCHSDRLSDCQDFLLIFVLGIGLLFSAADCYWSADLVSPVPSAFLLILVSAFCTYFSMGKHNSRTEKRKRSLLVWGWDAMATVLFIQLDVCYFSQSVSKIFQTPNHWNLPWGMVLQEIIFQTPYFTV